MSELLVPAVVAVVGPLVSGAIYLIARLTDTELRPVSANRPRGTDPAPAPSNAPRRAPCPPRTEISRG